MIIFKLNILNIAFNIIFFFAIRFKHLFSFLPPFIGNVFYVAIFYTNGLHLGGRMFRKGFIYFYIFLLQENK